MHPNTPHGLDRRGFLKFGVVGTGLLMGAGMLGSLQGCATHPLASHPERPLKLLREKDAAIMSAVAPVILKGQLPDDPAQKQQSVDRLLVNLDEFLWHSSEYAHGEFKKLFDLMYLAPTRVMLTGIWSSWENASEEDVTEFLNNARDSSLNMKRLVYAQLTQLTSLVYYSDPQSWTDDMYPGPPQHVSS